jgi:hypothetical protein
MNFARWKKCFAVIAIVLAAALVALLGSQHRLRLVVESFTKLDRAQQAYWSPWDKDGHYMSINTVSSPGNETARALAILTDFHNTHPTQPGDPLPTIDDPDSCKQYLEQGRPLHCYNVDIGMAEVLAAHGIYTRLWDLSGPNELGGYGHNLLEVWDNSAHSWKAIDPYYHCYFTLGGDSTPLSFADLRASLLASPAMLTMRRYYYASPERDSTAVLSEFRFLIPCVELHANNDFRWRYNHRYGFLMPMAAIFDKLPLRMGRAVRTLMLGSDDPRYIIEDSYSPHYPIDFTKGLFYTLLILFFISICLSLDWRRLLRLTRKTSER